MSELVSLKEPNISIVNNDGVTCYNANKEAMDRIKALSDADFEKEIAKFSDDTKMFMRLAREHNGDIEC